ncbi:MAG TPA: anti-sigma factor antagonist [Phycisphaerales bacterium]|nr:anti-sigma factor antagonist [Phycisphaerales bacterium]
MDQMSPNLQIDYHGNVAVATLTDEKILEDEQIQALEGSFMPLIEQSENIQLIIDFSNVKFLTSSVLGLLIRISKKVYEKNGKLRLCAIEPKIMDVFRITRLDKIFEIFPDQDDALVGLKR